MMRLTRTSRLVILLSLFASGVINVGEARTQSSALPNPVLAMLRAEPYQTGGKTFIRYKFEVHNRDAYPDALFAAAPKLPPCGSNTKASRTWIDFYQQNGKRLYGFCALSNHNDLDGIWFALEADIVPPSYVYIEMTDRETGIKYRSNLADTTM